MGSEVEGRVERRRWCWVLVVAGVRCEEMRREELVEEKAREGAIGIAR